MYAQSIPLYDPNGDVYNLETKRNKLLANPNSNVGTIINPMNPIYAGGAKCDNVADDSAAFQAALNTGSTVVVPPKKACKVGNLVQNSGSSQMFTGYNSSLNAIDNANWVLKTTGYMPYTSGLYINDAGKTVSQAVVTAGMTTSVALATVVNGGSGGTAGACTLTGTTGVGAKFVGTVSLAGTALVVGQNVTVSVPGAYSGNLTNYQNESVTTAGCGGLTGVTLAFNMTGQTTVNVGSLISGPPIQVRQALSKIQEDNGAYMRELHNGLVNGEPSYTQQCAPTFLSPQGDRFWSTFGTVYITNAYRPVMTDVRWYNGCWGAFNFDDLDAGTDSQRGVNYPDPCRTPAWPGSIICLDLSLVGMFRRRRSAILRMTGGMVRNRCSDRRRN